ncbi:HNH endonuclease [Hymenobacter sp. 15J16-1T3B]|uniref:HNH endonuclease n=1 Tax=Hymenobacter sp. 15J16-1T3B TaxID=2886941 RepID=UPI001D110DF3|nr:HNH endonuclease [Hymenobacter sp. 15J16-1T3B]MCC3156835.1 HNH endonuclease [Hymenobacter sp. 15J16-1T3B]
MTWLEYIVKAFDNLGGLASYTDLYEEIERIRPEPLSPQWKATVRRTIETHSSHSANHGPGQPDLFYSVEGLGKGIWALRNYQQFDTPASDVAEPESKYAIQVTLRVIRDSTLAHELKRLYQYRCQICEHSIVLNTKERYAEGHHIKPLGNPHGGPDITANMIVLCPNHHAELDFGARQLFQADLKIVKHSISQLYLDYHNYEIYPYR